MRKKHHSNQQEDLVQIKNYPKAKNIIKDSKTQKQKIRLHNTFFLNDFDRSNIANKEKHDNH